MGKGVVDMANREALETVLQKCDDGGLNGLLMDGRNIRLREYHHRKR